MLEDKLTQLKDIVNISSTVLAPLASSIDASKHAGMTNDELNMIESLLQECCILLEENTEAESSTLQNDAFGKMTARDFALSVAQRVVEVSRVIQLETMRCHMRC